MFCTNCGTQLPPEAKFCPNCGNDVKIDSLRSSDVSSATPISYPKGNTQQEQNPPILTAAVAKFKEQMKLAHFLNIACEGVALLYALIVPAYKLRFDAIATIILMVGIMVLGAVLLIIGAVYAAKTYDAMLGQPGAWKTLKIASTDQADLKYSGKFYTEISSALMIGSMIVILIRSSL